MHSVILADDHPLLLHGLRDMLGMADDFEVVGTAANGEEALSLIRELEPDIAVLDIAMPRMSGLDVLHALQANASRPGTILLTATISGAQVARAVSDGVQGILLKEYAPEALLKCMRHVAQGKKWLPDDLAVQPATATDRAAERIELLTPREREIAALICGGLSNRTIAQRLGISEGTIGVHLHNIFQKLEITNRTTLAALHFEFMASRNG